MPVTNVLKSYSVYNRDLLPVSKDSVKLFTVAVVSFFSDTDRGTPFDFLVPTSL